MKFGEREPQQGVAHKKRGVFHKFSQTASDFLRFKLESVQKTKRNAAKYRKFSSFLQDETKASGNFKEEKEPNSHAIRSSPQGRTGSSR